MFGVLLRRRVLPSSAVYSTSLPSARYSDSPPLVVASASPAWRISSSCVTCALLNQMPRRVRSVVGLADRVVVNLPVDVLAGGNPLADVGAVRVDAAARHPRQQLVRARQRGVVGASGGAGAAIGRRLAVGHHQPAVDDRRAFGNVDDEDAGVVDDRAIARTNLERLGELVLAPRHLRVEHLHAELAFGGDREVDRHLEDRVRLAAERPALGELRQRRQIGVAALRRAAVDPRDDGVDLRLRQAAIVAHLAASARDRRPTAASRATPPCS